VKQKTFIVYRRAGNVVTPFEAWIRRSAKGWVKGQPVGVTLELVVGNAVPWAALYAGHTAWVGDQIARRNDAIKQERSRRALRKGVASAGPVLSKAAV
jgi:hypothetical protein